MQSSALMEHIAKGNQTKKYDFQTFSFLSDLGLVPVTRLK
jgi:hypothetical protein